MDNIVEATLTQAPYDFALNTLLVSGGSNTITARVLDKAGNQTDASIPVTIQGQLGITITSPADNATINKTSMIVKGKVNNTGNETGVVINGVLAQISGNGFAAIVPLQIGQNIITATATDADNRTGRMGSDLKIELLTPVGIFAIFCHG